MTETPHQCIGFADKAFATPCPEPVTSLIRVSHDGDWASWKEACDFHATAAVDVLSVTEGYEIKRQALCADCPELLRNSMREIGTDITVSLARPVVAGPYTTEPFTCPHGITYWIEPTGEQIAAWVRDGVK